MSKAFKINRLKLVSFNMIPTNDIYVLLTNESQHKIVASDVLEPLIHCFKF